MDLDDDHNITKRELKTYLSNIQNVLLDYRERLTKLEKRIKEIEKNKTSC